MGREAARTIDQPISPLKILRKERKLRQKDIAYGVPCAASIISDIEVYNYRPNLEIQQNIAAFLGVSIKDIWPDENN